MSIILSLETSCDESAAALVSNEKGKIDLLANEIASQIEDCLLYTSDAADE